MLYLMTFSSHFDAIFANRTLKSAGLDVRLSGGPEALLPHGLGEYGR